MGTARRNWCQIHHPLREWRNSCLEDRMKILTKLHLFELLEIRNQSHSLRDSLTDISKDAVLSWFDCIVEAGTTGCMLENQLLRLDRRRQDEYKRTTVDRCGQPEEPFIASRFISSRETPVATSCSGERVGSSQPQLAVPHYWIHRKPVQRRNGGHPAVFFKSDNSTISIRNNLHFTYQDRVAHVFKALDGSVLTTIHSPQLKRGETQDSPTSAPSPVQLFHRREMKHFCLAETNPVRKATGIAVSANALQWPQHTKDDPAQKAYDRYVDPLNAYHTDFPQGCSYPHQPAITA